jgi:hypothetical protein
VTFAFVRVRAPWSTLESTSWSFPIASGPGSGPGLAPAGPQRDDLAARAGDLRQIGAELPRRVLREVVERLPRLVAVGARRPGERDLDLAADLLSSRSPPRARRG